MLANENFEIGQLVVGKGVYVGAAGRLNKDGLKQVWDLYAAPIDLTDENEKTLVTTYNEAVVALNAKKDWYGHDGECFENEDALYGAFANGTYDGGWFIGALGMVVDNLYHNRNGMPEGSEFVPCIVGDDRAGKYWSCLEYETNSRAGFAFIDRDDDGFGIVWDSKYRELSTRPMRAELWDSGLE